MKQSANAFAACVDTLISPEQAFNTIKDRKGWSWVRFLLVMIVSAGTFFYYFNIVDFEWLKARMIDDIVAAQPGMTDDEIKIIGDNYQPDIVTWTTIIGSCVIT